MKRNIYTRAARRAYVEELAVARVAMRLAAVLEASRKSQRDLAEELGVTEARVSQILNGDANPTVKTLARIADALGQEFDPTFSVASDLPKIAEVAEVVEDEQPVLVYVSESINLNTTETIQWKPATPPDENVSFEGWHAAA